MNKPKRRGLPFERKDRCDELLKRTNSRWRSLRSKQGLETLAQIAKLNSDTQAKILALMSIGPAGEALGHLYVCGSHYDRDMIRKEVKELLDLDLPAWVDAQANNPIFP